MSKFDEPLKVEVIGKALIIEPIVPDTAPVKKLKAAGQIPVGKPKPKNPLWEDSTTKTPVEDWDEHPFQAIVKALFKLIK